MQNSPTARGGSGLDINAQKFHIFGKIYLFPIFWFAFRPIRRFETGVINTQNAVVSSEICSVFGASTRFSCAIVRIAKMNTQTPGRGGANTERT